MEKHLKSSVDVNLDREINKISQVDAEIIVEIIEIVKKLGHNDLSKILSEWKKRGDDVIRDSLIDFGLDLNNGESIEGSEDEEGFSKTFILFDNCSIDTYFIVSISKKDKFNPKKGCMVYSILINEHCSDNNHYSGLEFDYYDAQIRDEKYNDLHINLSDTGKIKFY